MERAKQSEESGRIGGREGSAGKYDRVVVIIAADCDISVGAALCFGVVGVRHIYANNDCGGIFSNRDFGGIGIICVDFGNIHPKQFDFKKIQAALLAGEINRFDADIGGNFRIDGAGDVCKGAKCQ